MGMPKSKLSYEAGFNSVVRRLGLEYDIIHYPEPQHNIKDDPEFSNEEFYRGMVNAIVKVLEYFKQKKLF